MSQGFFASGIYANPKIVPKRSRVKFGIAVGTWFVVLSFDESGEELDARLREFRLEHGLTPNSALHTVRVRFNGPEELGK